jgi:quaternary ammonium compound-resistance protein SugE
MSNTAAWMLLILSGIADVVWAVKTKYSAGYTRLGWTTLSLAALLAFLGLLTQALKILPLGTAYAVWTGVGAVGSVLAGMVLFGEFMSATRLIAIAVIVAAIIVLKLTPA